MLFKEVEQAEKEKRELVTATGFCRFCGQATTRKALPEWTQEEINELATEFCDCFTAEDYTRKKNRMERAYERIDMLFVEDETVPVDESVVTLLREAVSPMCEDFIQSISIDTGKGIKGKLSLTAKGKIKVSRIITDTSAYEA
ncbi:MAG: hypothetical protein HFI40_14010 [Lachnospiraceae bacterium]|jgi:hypothetical protein|nr:hypothetical protein [Lachnospiraceae bacterium]